MSTSRVNSRVGQSKSFSLHKWTENTPTVTNHHNHKITYNIEQLKTMLYKGKQLLKSSSIIVVLSYVK